MTCFCYILQCSDGTLYTGWTVNVEKRISQHNKGLGAKYTKTRRPVTLVYIEPQPDKITALKRERAIKALPRKKKLELFLGNLPPRSQTITKV